jgi:hypothetical protein
MSSITSNSYLTPNWENLSFFRKKIYTFLSDKMPRRIKRLIFSASFYGMIEQKDTEQKTHIGKKIKRFFFIASEDKKIVEKINAELKLGKVSDNSLVFPMVVKSLIWKNLEKNPYFEFNHVKYDFRNIDKIKEVDPDLNYFTLFVISQMPIWLVYGSYSLIHYDIINLTSTL